VNCQRPKLVLLEHSARDYTIEQLKDWAPHSAGSRSSKSAGDRYARSTWTWCSQQPSTENLIGPFFLISFVGDCVKNRLPGPCVGMRTLRPNSA
jgi:hypothetical protein